MSEIERLRKLHKKTPLPKGANMYYSGTTWLKSVGDDRVRIWDSSAGDYSQPTPMDKEDKEIPLEFLMEVYLENGKLRS